ncbi:hypothetical protein MKEN_00526200 [Mycena kentingensis (nom. inval.)]|nr:hypothetical protein MKEN_00526200 [Mycena kentingensis (nom. inval.)]
MCTFAKLRLDPVASVDPTTRADPIAMEELKALVGQLGEYAGFVGVTPGVLWNPDSPYNTHRFYIIHRGPPYEKNPLFGNSPMCTAVAPTRSSERKALEPTRNFPWAATEAYMSILWSFKVRSRTAETFEQPGWGLSMDQIETFHCDAWADQRLHDAALCRLHNASGAADASPPPAMDSGPDWISNAIAEHMLPNLDNCKMITGTFSQDLSDMHELPPASALYRELGQIYKIMQAARARKVDALEAQIASVRLLDAEYDRETYARTEVPFLAVQAQQPLALKTRFGRVWDAPDGRDRDTQCLADANYSIPRRLFGASDSRIDLPCLATPLLILPDDHPFAGKWASSDARRSAGSDQQDILFYDPPPDLTLAGVPIVSKSDHTTAATTSSFSPAIPAKASLPTKFTSPPLLPGLVQSLQELFGPHPIPTPIQALSLKWVVEPWSPSQPAEAAAAVSTDIERTPYKEILFAAETGSGKSLAYLLPMLQALKLSEHSTISPLSKRAYAPRALVLAPTHELARQIAASAKSLVHAPDTRLRVVSASRANVPVQDPTVLGKGKQNASASAMKASMAFIADGASGEFRVGERENERVEKRVDVLVGTPMKVMEMVRGRGWDRDAGLGQESAPSDEKPERGPKLRRGRDSLPGVGVWRSNPELDLCAIEWVIVDEADVLYDSDFQETTRLLLADISAARGFPVPLTSLPVGLWQNSSSTNVAVADRTSASVIAPLNYPFHLVLTSATIPTSLSTYLNAYHPKLLRLVSPNVHHLPKNIRTEYVSWTGGNKNADIERRLRKVWAEDAAQGYGPHPSSLGPMSKVLVFCNRNSKVLELGEFLDQKGIKNVQLSSKSENRQRGNNKHLDGFLKLRGMKDPKDGQAESPAINDPMHVPHVLITTSLLSRGLDFSTQIKHVFITEEPRNMIDFLHRAGRTGRGGAKGTVVLFGKKEGRGSLRARAAWKRVKALRPHALQS